MSNNTDTVTLVWMSDITAALRMSSASTCRQWILKQGFSFEKKRNPKTSLNGLCLTQQQLNDLIQIRISSGFWGNKHQEETVIIGGLFYLVLPVPELSRLRVKLGFTTDIKQRLLNYKTICPNAYAFKTWDCLPEWEKVTIASCTRVECTQQGVEVFDCKNLDNLVARIDQFFEMMPKT